ncbi:ArgS-related anticodon-binding protein NrtL [Streptomyces sp. NPDC091272]|uniref:ArgS-related anticodon-binding protein NrtL n=1 Tax=Streptomyces sp. NPDC091272 TaxID=3365981 RepID=UPI00380E000B
MTPAELSRTVLRAVCRAVEEDVLPAPVPERAFVERTRPGGTGEYASSVALRLARGAGRPAREVAEILRERLADAPGLAAVEVTGPGFLNFTLDAGSGDEVVRQLLAQGGGEVVRQSLAQGGGEVARPLLAQGAGGSDAAGPSAHPMPALPVPTPAPAALARLGHDAAVWALLLPAADTDLLAQHERNPLFRVRYAYSRTRALRRNAADLGFGPSYENPGRAVPETAPDITPEPAPETTPGIAPELVPGRLVPETAPEAAAELMALLGAWPVELDAAGRLGAPERVARYLVTVADAFLRFHDTVPVLPLGDEKPSAAHRSRLALAEAAGTVLAGGLSQLGISAPDHL